jgi:predicted nucleic acid-binding protein
MRIPASLRSRRVFADTSAYFALVEPREASHTPALAINRWLAEQRLSILTTNFVLAETHALVLRRLGRTIALQILESIDQSATVIVRVSARDERRAREIIRQYDDKSFSLTDATSFAVMERLHIRDVFTFDSDFEQFGFQRIDPPRR